MGAFFTNVSVRVNNEQTVHSYLENKQIVHLYSVAKSNWVTVYPKNTESQDPEELKAISSDLSKQFSTYALSFIVHDSDVLMYYLYLNGELIDEFNSDPDYFSTASDDEKKRVKGKPEVLLQLAKSGTTIEQIETALNTRTGFAEDIVSALAMLLEIDEPLEGYNYRSENQ